MSNANAISNVLGSFGGQLGLVNTSMGAKSADGTINISSTAQGVAATVESQFALAGKSWGPAQAVIGAWGVLNTGWDIATTSYEKGSLTITGAQAASLAGNTVNVGMGLAKSNPWGAAATVVTTVAEFGLNLATGSPKPDAVADYSNEHRRTPSSISSNAPANAAAKVAVQTHVNDLSNLAALGRAAANGATANAAEAAAQAAERARAEAQAAEAAARAKAEAQARARANESSSSSSSSSSYQSALNTTPGSNYGRSMDGYHMAPIVIDLDGDGVELRPLSSSATFFDTDSDNYQERTAWAGADDGILVIDLDGDGQVTQAKEIAFAEWTEEQDSDLQALGKVFDSNQDGVFDIQDERFAEFRIWKDANSNGVAANAPQFYLIA